MVQSALTGFQVRNVHLDWRRGNIADVDGFTVGGPSRDRFIGSNEGQRLRCLVPDEWNHPGGAVFAAQHIVTVGRNQRAPEAFRPEGLRRGTVQRQGVGSGGLSFLSGNHNQSLAVGQEAQV